MNFTLYPALDLRGGRVVRLRQGDFARETRYPIDPLARAAAWAAAGASWLHLVDLDAARAGSWSLDGLLAALRLRTPLRLQVGGGVRGEDDIRRRLAAGADRVVIGSLAVREPERVPALIDRFGAERITVALDTRRAADGRWLLPLAGWTTPGEAELETHLERLAQSGLRHLLCTDIGRDGTLAGPNLDLCRRILELAPRLALQASGGLRHAADVAAARQCGCAGAVVGRALLEGALPLAELAARRAEAPC